MKLTRKVLAMVLALTMILGLALSVSAAEHNHTISVHNPETGYTYTAYQIFKGDLNTEGVLSNIEWGTGVDGDGLLAELKTTAAYANCNDAAAVASILASADKAMDDPIAMAFAEIAAKYVTTGTESVRNTEKSIYEITGLQDGYYLVVNTGIPEGAENTTVSRFILEVVRNIAVTHKGTFPSVEKKIIEAELKLDVNQAPIGKDVNYEITGTLPSTLDTYQTYYYAFHDTLSKGLTYNENAKVTVNGVDVTEYFYIEASEYDEVNGTTIFVGIQDILALELLKDAEGNQIVGDITKDTLVILTYSAKVNENAVIAGNGNPNEVFLEYDNDPNTEGGTTPPPPNPDKPTPPDPTGVTPKDKVVTYVTELTILKKDGAGNALAGAEFTLSGDAVYTMVVTRETFAPATGEEVPVYWELNDGSFTNVAPVYDDPNTDENEDTSHAYKTAEATHVIKEVVEIIEKTESVAVKAFVGEDGYLTFTGLGAGTYTLTESVTPAGFNTIDPITFTVEFDAKTGLFSCPNNWIMVESDNTLYAEIINVAGSTLPSTGGIGTTLFYVFGGLMVAGAAVLLVTKKRMAA